jgi:hypothetical protein
METYKAYRHGKMITSGTISKKDIDELQRRLKFDFGADYLVIVYSDDTLLEFDLNDPDLACEPW